MIGGDSATGTGGKMALKPCLHDRYAEAGVTKSEYFWQDLLVARWIHEANPERHVDVGSRTDGFVAHVASFREIEVFDVRPVTIDIPGIRFTQADIVDANALPHWQEDIAEGDAASRSPAVMRSNSSSLARMVIQLSPKVTEPASPTSTISLACSVRADVSLPVDADWTGARRVQRRLGLRSAQHPRPGQRTRT
jgi:hypothetical protein